MRWILAACCTVLFMITGLGHAALANQLGFADPKTVDVDSKVLNRIDEVVLQALHRGDTPGAVVLVARRGKVVFRKAYGNKTVKPRPEAMKVDTIFDIASLTKIMATAPAIMQLVEEGKLSLTDRVSDILPDFAKSDKRKKEITIKQCLTHFSGLPPLLDLTEPWEGIETAEKMAMKTKLQNPPNTKFVYSDVNYIIAAAIVRKLSGESINQFTRKNLYQPLGMNSTTYTPDISWQPKIAPTEKRMGNWLRGKVHDPTTYRMGGISGQAGLFASADDVAIFGQMILNQGQFQGVRVLHPRSIQTMIQNQAPIGQGVQRGIGFDIDSPYSSVRGDLFPKNSFGHTGFTGTSLWIDPNSETILVILTNRLHPEGKGNVVALRKRIANVVASSLL